MTVYEWLRSPWPWYISGPLIGLMVPALLLLGNKTFGISSSLRHICAACLPARVPFFHYDWKKESWNLFFVGGVLLGGLCVAAFLQDPRAMQVDGRLVQELSHYGITDFNDQLPRQLFGWDQLLSVRGMIMMVGGGFLVGFGTRYAGGCTSGHSIMGISNLQLPSLLATMSFMAGGFLVANLVLPHILQL